MTRATSTALAVLVTALCSGCMHPGPQSPARTGPFFTPANHIGDASLAGIRRVVVLPVWVGPATPPESAAQLDSVFVTALQQQNRFEVVSLSRAECLRRFRAEAISSAAALPHDLIATLRREYAVDAVMFVDLTVFEPYQPLALGLRAKLATVLDTRLVWSFDNVFSAADPAVANSARHHHLDHDRSVPTDMTGIALQSPSRFAAYAATAMFATLPPVTPPPPVVERKVWSPFKKTAASTH